VDQPHRDQWNCGPPAPSIIRTFHATEWTDQPHRRFGVRRADGGEWRADVGEFPTNTAPARWH
jgi:hypothetical protein